jgi:hypothetical protein
VGLYYNPPSPHIGGRQPLEPKQLTPASGPTPNDPPFNGGSRVSQAVLSSWFIPAAAVVLQELFVPAAPAQAAPVRVPDAIYQSWSSATAANHFAALQVVTEVAAKLTPPVSGPLPSNPPFMGGAQVPEQVSVWWIPPPPQPQFTIPLDPPQSGPTPDNPPFAGGAEVPQAVLNWWIPPPPAPQSSILLKPPISGPVANPFIGGRIPAPILEWWSAPDVIVDLVQSPGPQVAPDSPTVASDKRLADILASWIPKPPAAITSRLLSPPQSGPAPQNPPISGGAKVPAAVLHWWAATSAAPLLPELFVPAAPAQADQIAASRVPDAVYQAWNLAPPGLSLRRLLTPPISGPTPDNPPFNGGAEVSQPVLNWWIAPPATLSVRRPLPPISAAVTDNPPFVGGSRIPAAVLTWWAVPPTPLPQSSPEFVPAVVATYVAPVGLPVAIAQWWSTSTPLPQLRKLFVPPAAAVFTFPPAGVAAPVLQWWSVAQQAVLLPRPLTPPQSGPAADNPPLGGARIAAPILRWWFEPPAPVYLRGKFGSFLVGGHEAIPRGASVEAIPRGASVEAIPRDPSTEAQPR